MAGGRHLDRETLALLEEQDYELKHEAACYGDLFRTVHAVKRPET